MPVELNIRLCKLNTKRYRALTLYLVRYSRLSVAVRVLGILSRIQFESFDLPRNSNMKVRFYQGHRYVIRIHMRECLCF